MHVFNSFFFWMIIIGNYREFFLKLFCMKFKLRKCFFLRKFNVRKLSLFDWLNTISGIASVGRGWVSTGRRFCHSVVGVLQFYLEFRVPTFYLEKGCWNGQQIWPVDNSSKWLHFFDWMVNCCWPFFSS